MKTVLKKSVSAALAVVMILCALFCTIGSNAISSNTAGDINADKSVDNKDVVVLFRYLSGSVDKDSVDIIACDTNGDGETDNKDVVLLFRHLSNPSIEIFYGKEGPAVVPEYLYDIWDSKTAAAFESPKQTTVSVTDDGIRFDYVNGSPVDPFIKFNITKYAKLTGKSVPTGADGAYIVLKVRSNADGYIEVFTHKPAAGDSASATYKADETFRYVIVDMTKTTFTTPSKLTTVRFDWAGGEAVAGSYMVISEIGFFSDLDSALKYTKLKETDINKESASILSFPTDKEVSGFVTTPTSNTNIYSKTEDNVRSALITSRNSAPNVTVNVRELAELDGKAAVKGDYLAVRIRVTGQSNLKVILKSITDVSGYTVTVTNQTAEIDCSKEGWQGVMFNIRNTAVYEDQIKKINLALTGFESLGTAEIGGVAVSDNINDALTVCEHTEYCLNYDSSLTDNDELANVVLTAPDEDGSVKLWFDQSTEKTYQSVTKSTGRTGYTVRMAKNESENCQFFIAPEKDMKVRIQIDDFKNENGDKVSFEAFYEYYHNLNNILMPDAIPPLTGPVEIKGGNSQGFVIQLTTYPDTPAGLYESVVHVFDENTGKEIKRAAVAVKVWNFELSEKTELRTSFALYSNYITNSYNWSKVDFTDVEVVQNYFEFFLKYRINVMDVVPRGLTSSYGNKYMSQERVNTARWTNLDMSIAEDNDGVTPDWIDKVIYYPGDLDEPRADWQFALFKSFTDRIKANTPDYRMVIPFERDCDLTADGKITTFANASVDSIEFMKDYVNIWCPETFSFTTRDLAFIPNVTYLQSKEQDEKYGSFIDRMKNEVEGGDELWAYVCINPRAPYANWKVDTDGTETIVSIWQMKEYDVTGMLYWSLNTWKVNYWDQSTPWAFPNDGDGMLIYSGYKFGLPTPVSTLRLESIRDGIEDYQMLCMLEDALGEQAANDMISRITTSVVTFATNDDYIHAVRVLLGDTLEEALNK